ncbi:hypothetical protein [Altererythrobacter fulvus]|uniref:hypothetical protein n=1 Tax=Caenibius fulvus TaxID=2126012 RepID=UPI0030165C69
MNQFIFKNRWFAVGFVAFILLSAYLLVGDERGGLVTGLTGSLAGDQQDQTEPQPANAGQAAPPPMLSESEMEQDNVDHLEDEELIDPASGTDPTPPDIMGQSEEEAGGESPPEADNAQSAPRVIEYVNGVPVLDRLPQ